MYKRKTELRIYLLELLMDLEALTDKHYFEEAYTVKDITTKLKKIYEIK